MSEFLTTLPLRIKGLILLLNLYEEWRYLFLLPYKHLTFLIHPHQGEAAQPPSLPPVPELGTVVYGDIQPTKSYAPDFTVVNYW